MSRIHVLCVIQEETYTNLEDIMDIQIYCNKNNILFGLRLFNPEKHTKDSIYIEQLPSFHIYIEHEYFATMNISHNPLGYLKYLKDTYDNDMKPKQDAQTRKEAWLHIIRKVRTQNTNSLL